MKTKRYGEEKEEYKRSGDPTEEKKKRRSPPKATVGGLVRRKGTASESAHCCSYCAVWNLTNGFPVFLAA